MLSQKEVPAEFLICYLCIVEDTFIIYQISKNHKLVRHVKHRLCSDAHLLTITKLSD